MSALRYPCRVCLRKLAVLPGRNPDRVPVGACYVGEAKAPSRPGHKFRLVRSESGRSLITSTVQRLLNAHTFLTHNSVYQLEAVAAPTLRATRKRRNRRVARKVGRPSEKVAVHLRFSKPASQK